RSRFPLIVEALEVRDVPATINGVVFLDYDNSGAMNGPDVGIAGVTITLTGGNLDTPLTRTTDAQGTWGFTGLAAGTYVVTETQPVTPANQDGKATAGPAGGTPGANTITGIVLTANTTASGNLFAEVPLVGTGGAVFEDTNGNGKKDNGEPAVVGATVTLTGNSVVTGNIAPKTTTTDSSGAYSFTGLTPGIYTIAETQPAGYSDGAEQNGTPAATVTNDKFANIDLTKTAAVSGGFNFGEIKGGFLTGLVFADANNDGIHAASGEPGIAGVRIRIVGTDATGAAVNRVVNTDASGAFTFSNLRTGTYSLFETQPPTYADGIDKSGTPAGVATVNDRITGINFVASASASGYTFAEQARADLRLRQTPVSATTDVGGNLTITYTLTNRGSATATAASVLVNFDGLDFMTASLPAAFNSTTRVWTVGDVAPGATATIKLTFQGSAAGNFAPTAHATTTSSELSTKNNTSVSYLAIGVVAPPSGGGSLPSLWFLSSSTSSFHR
ncbi:MAG TPA: SdrD B-like domain-containing protein, partial [Gemmataceae bacterium]|nr:SdrD B-like domain-containing protein [Gemmataceae bacterium]